MSRSRVEASVPSSAPNGIVGMPARVSVVPLGVTDTMRPVWSPSPDGAIATIVLIVKVVVTGTKKNARYVAVPVRVIPRPPGVLAGGAVAAMGVIAAEVIVSDSGAPKPKANPIRNLA